MKRILKEKNLSKKIFIVLFIILIGSLLFRIFQYKDNYLVKFDPLYWEHRYLISQWVVPNSKNSIGDDGLYAYAGYKYIFGMNPILNSAEVPPLGKYLIGLTILIFRNQNVFGIITGIEALILFYLFNTMIFKKKLLAFLPVFIFAIEPLFWEQLQANYLDLLYLSFLFAVLFFSIRKQYIPASLALGCFTATKFPPTSILVALSIFLYILTQNRKDIFKLLFSFILWPAVFVVSYLRFFMLGNGVIEFLKVLKYFIHYYQIGVKSQDHLMVFDMLFRGQWPTWWNGVIPVAEWNIIWPIAIILTVISLFMWRKVIKSPIMLVLCWIFFYFLFLMVIPVTPRYLLLLMPFLYNVSVWVLSESINTKSFRRLR